MKAIVGLGNPGSEYEGTRHNIGFMVTDVLTETLRTEFAEGKGDYLIAESRFSGEKTLLVKPLTYMNNSGLAVADLMERFEISRNELLVVCDDFNLPLGRIRLRANGSDGGHNGLYSIIYQLQSEEFPRLRCGIGKPGFLRRQDDTTRFVLSPFDDEEKPVVSKMVHDSHDAALTFIRNGIFAAMTRWNPAPDNPAMELSNATESTSTSENKT